MKIVRTVLIQAQPEVVFDTVTGFALYSQWNPWIVKAEGDCHTGANVVVDVLMGNRRQQYNHRIVQVNRPNVFHWCDVGWFTWFADGERIRTFEAHAQGTQYTVTLNITGPLEFLARWLFGTSLEEGMTRETQALKSYIEARVQ